MEHETSGKLIFLGTGNPEGIPVPFCSCPVCSGGKVQRLRPSVLIEYQGKNYLIDVGPDFREQMLRYGIRELSGVFFTHEHYDHIGGIDDLRSWYLTFQRPLPVVMSGSTYRYIQSSKGYLLTPQNAEASLPAVLDFRLLNEPYGEGVFEGLPYRYVSYFQRSCGVTGFCFGNLAYLTDISRYERKIFGYLEHIDTLILSVSASSGFMGRASSHLTLSEAESFAEHLGVQNVIFTHIGHVVEQEILQYPGRTFAYDGMEVIWSQ
ncbi:MBL fold metallo-hydrolase [Chlamydia pecorum]|uniref:Metal dependent hydrolase n=4 Tax=Chlamydia pecorum TaxID=85991 RepID=A0AA34WHY8_CHLPE|nr:metal dependent hydrolase [Chlamydia pecorum E58]AGW38687.1 metal dependent hydrolase [Chlamydia pecorum W73]AGW39612.1 metal dependent hydrolase [Chlamydia pecorum P787]KTF29321.1 metallo-beta-lactamase superfamily protein [Chlamydia pecorum]KZN27729.1 metallo-beta-lactamase superfamily protein [Chlamydia pecorum]